MKTTLLVSAASAAFILITGCARTGAPTGANDATAASHVRTSANAAPNADDTRATLLDATSASSAASQKSGDFVVYRFTGSFRKKPLTLTQRVVEVKGMI